MFQREAKIRNMKTVVEMKQTLSTDTFLGPKKVLQALFTFLFLHTFFIFLPYCITQFHMNNHCADINHPGMQIILYQLAHICSLRVVGIRDFLTFWVTNYISRIFLEGGSAFSII